MRKYFILSAILFPALLLGSCKSLNNPLDFDSAPLYGMIYDYQNKPVKSVELYEDDILIGESDINGRFYLPDMEKGIHNIRFKKTGYETLDFQVDFENKTEVLYIKIRSAFDCLVDANILMSQSSFKDAQDMIERGLTIKEGDSGLLYLRSILYFQMQDYQKSYADLEALFKAGRRDEAMYRLLTDIFKASDEEQANISQLLNEYPPHPSFENIVAPIKEKEHAENSEE